MTITQEDKAVESLAAELSLGLGDGFTVVALGHMGFVAILSTEFGVAAVVPSGSDVMALAASERMGLIAKAAGVEIRPLPFGVSSGAVAPPVIVRERYMSIDILMTMGRSKDKAALTPETIARVAKALTDIPRPVPALPISPNILLVAETAVKKILNNEPAWLYGIDIGAKEIVSPYYLLPAILVAAAQKWAAPVVAAGKSGGFLVRLTPDKNAVLGFAATSLEISNPVLFFLPIVDLVRRSYKGGECWMDDIVEDFSAYMVGRGYNSDSSADIEVRVATSS